MKSRFTKLEEALSKFGNPKVATLERRAIPRSDPRSPLVKKLETTGIENISKKITIREDGLFEIGGEQIVIYIKDHTLINEKEKLESGLNKIHLMECKKIQEMRRENRYKRYVASQAKTGWFKIDTKWGEMEKILRPCQFCLGAIGYNGFANAYDDDAQDIVTAFNINEFFETHESRFVDTPQYTDTTSPDSTYAGDWHKHSYDCRQRSGWICQKCGVNLRKCKWLLDAHHKNGVKYDNNPNNLEALCKICHRKKPFHSHMSARNDRIIERLRKEQRIKA